MTARVAMTGFLGTVAILLLTGATPALAFTTDGQEDICARADIVFCENWEQDRTSACMAAGTCPNKYKSPSFICCPNTQVSNIVSTAPSDGTKTLMATINCTFVTGNDCGAGWVEWNITPGLTTVYFRYYYKVASTFQQATIANKIFETKISSFNSEQLFLGHHSNDLLIHVVNDPVTGQLDQNIGTPVPVVKGTWQCLEFGVTLNSTTSSSDGVIDGWIDDVHKFHYTGLQIFTTGPIDLGFFRFTNAGYVGGIGQTVSGERYIDRIVIGTSRIGCSSALSGSPRGFILRSHVLLAIGVGAIIATAAWRMATVV